MMEPVQLLSRADSFHLTQEVVLLAQRLPSPPALFRRPSQSYLGLQTLGEPRLYAILSLLELLHLAPRLWSPRLPLV